MGIVVMAKADNAFKEFFLPAVNNTDYTLRLEGELFQLMEDVCVHLEILDNQWSFVESRDYMLSDESGQKYFGQQIKNGDRLLLITGRGERIVFVVIESDSSFQIFRKYDITAMNQITIGSHASNNIQYTLMTYISQNHATIIRTNGSWILYDQSTNGTFVGGRKIHGTHVLQFGDCITIFGLRIVFLGNVIAVCDKFGTDVVDVKGMPEYYQEVSGKTDVEIAPVKKFFKRSPRNIRTICNETVDIEAPPAFRATKEKPLFMVIGPSFTMVIPMLLGTLMAMLSATTSGKGTSVYMFTGIITAVGSAILGTVWALTNMKYEKQVRQEEKEQRYNAYGNYLIEIADMLKGYYENNQRAMNEMYISAEQCCNYNEDTLELWNRNDRHEDFLAVRLGVGSLPFQVQISIPKKKFELYMDDLNEKPAQIQENYSVLHNVPVCMNLLEKRLIGIVGGKGLRGARQIVEDIAAQIGACNCYTDVKMAFLYEKQNQADENFWSFARWLPHAWTEDKKTRLVAENKNDVSDVCYELAYILRRRVEESASDGENKMLPHYVLFVENPKLLEGELLAKYALNPKEEYGLTTILMVEKYADLPNCCENIIQNDGSVTAIYNLTETKTQNVTFDTVGNGRLEEFARRLSDIEVNETVSMGEIPAALDFFEMYGVHSLEELNVAERWTKNRTYESLKALLGKKGGGSECYLDIHEKFHGPHGLVAGTTGSGKSETLQTYMLSLAVNFSPYDIGFFIIDFKGGGMANLFSNLPHLIGQISNLSGNQVRRAMISIKSEITRRQRVFTANSVNNINLYTRLYKNGEATQPIQHLFIIIDEFAELKKEEPEFMKELISVAQVGRSLGIHLILATQKPSGTVDDNIWSNSKFRLCLRVQDRQDSNDMLHKPDAAYITQAGRGFLQVGNDEVYEQFQSGYSGAAYDSEVGGSKGAIATMLTLTGKTAVVGNRMKKQKKEMKRREWLIFLIQVFRKVADSYGATLEEMVMAERFTELYPDIFTGIEAAGYTYENSVTGRLRLQELADMLITFKGMPDEDIVDYICTLGDRNGWKIPEVKDKTQLEAVVDYLGVIAAENHYEESMALWLPVLPVMLPWNKLEGTDAVSFHDNWNAVMGRWNLNVMLGLYDDPENQEQQPLVIDFGENGHYAVCGTVVTGKSTFLQTLVYAMIQKYTPEWVNFYILDFSSRMLSCFENAPHVGGIVYDDNPERTKKLFHMLNHMMDERKQILKGGNYQQYVQVNGVKLPSVVVVIDNYANFREKTNNQYDNILLRLSREGVGYGIFCIFSSAGFGSMEIPHRIGDNIRSVVTLEMGDRFKFAEALRVPRVEVLPEIDVKGRGLANIGGRILEFQTAVAVEVEDDYKRSEYIEVLCKKMNDRWEKNTARRIPEIPEKPMLVDFVRSEEYAAMLASGERLPVAYHQEDASYYGINLRTAYCYLISGKARTGKTNFLKNIIYAAGRLDNAELCVIENSGSELMKIAENVNAQYLTTDQQIFDYFKGTVSVFKERNGKKRTFLQQEMEDDEIFDAMKTEKPIFIFLADLSAFIQGIYRKLENGSSMSGYLENIMEKGRLHNFYFFGCLNTDEATKLTAHKVYNSYVGYHQGVHLGGNVGSQRIHTFSNISFAEQNKGSKVGIGLAVSENEPSIAETIVIPLAKGV